MFPQQVDERSAPAETGGQRDRSPDPITVRRDRPSRLPSLVPVATTVGLLGVWEVLARASVLPAEIPPLTTVLGRLGDALANTALWTALGQTLWHWFAGLATGVVLGVALGVAIGLVPIVHRLLEVPLEFLRPIPTVVYLPLVILVMGSRSPTAVLLTAVGAVWPMLFQTAYGVRSIDQQTVETARMFGLSRAQILANVTPRSVLPYVATGVRISSSLALVVAVSVELVGGVPGLGAAMADAAQNGVYPQMYGLLLITGLIGLALNAVLERAERKLVGWHTSHRSADS